MAQLTEIRLDRFEESREKLRKIYLKCNSNLWKVWRTFNIVFCGRSETTSSSSSKSLEKGINTKRRGRGPKAHGRPDQG